MEPDHRSRRSRRDVVVDSLLTVFAALYGLAGFASYGGDLYPVDRVPDWLLWLDLAFLPACCAALWWRRSHPLTVALGMALVSVFSVTAVGALVVALISLAAYRPFPRAAAVTLLTVVLSLPWVVLVPQGPGGSIVTMVMIVVVLSACLDRARLELLSVREREVAEAVTAGLSNAEIADRLYMSMGTVKAHVSSALTKLDVGGRIQLALLAHDAQNPD